MGKSYNLTVSGIEPLEDKLKRMNAIRFEAIKEKQLVQILDRARAEGGTPFDTGELRKSSSKSDDCMGYTADYAAHVEYGHRTVDGGFVSGQYYLCSNVKAQQPIYKADLLKAIEKG